MARKRSPHPGIVVRPGRPSRGEAPHIRYRDPHTKRYQTERLPDLQGPALAKWLARRSIELQTRRIASAPPPGRGMPVPEAVDRYFAEAHIAESTRKTYGYAAKHLTKWGLAKYTGEMDLAALRSLRVALAPPGLSPHSVNSRLKGIKVIISHWRKAGWAPRLTLEIIKDGLGALPAPLEAPEFLRLADIRRLVSVDMDAEERAFVMTLLLTGMRRGECLGLTWEEVDAETQEIRLGARTKTRRWRLIDLRVCPSVLDTLLQWTPDPADRRGRVFSLGSSRLKKLAKKLKAVPSTFQQLRETCSTYLVNAPGIYGAQSLWLAALQLGHSPEVAKDYYAGQLRNIPASAKTLEAAMGLPDQPDVVHEQPERQRKPQGQ